MSSVLDLVHEVLHPDGDPQLLNEYLRSLQTHQPLRQKPAKEVQAFESAINDCLNSSSGRLNGLLALTHLIDQSSAQLFQDRAFSWHQQTVRLIKPTEREPVVRQCCNVTLALLRYSPQFSEVSRQLAAAAGNLIAALLDFAAAHAGCIDHALAVVEKVLTLYPGSCGGSATAVEKFLISHMHPTFKKHFPAVTRCFALLPRLGGGGRDGVYHRLGWSTSFQKVIRTMSVQIDVLMANVEADVKGKSNQEVEVLPLPKSSSKAILSQSFFIRSQFAALSECAEQLLQTPFLYGKSLDLEPLFELIDRGLHVTVSQVEKENSHESKVLVTVLPDIQKNLVDLLSTLVLVCQDDLLCQMHLIRRTVKSVLKATDLDIRTAADGTTQPLGQLRCSVYRLITRLCEQCGYLSGLDTVAGEIVSAVARDVTPKTEVVTLAKESKKKGKTYFNNTIQRKHDHRANTDVVVSACEALEALFNGLGTLIPAAIHIQAQTMVLTMCWKVAGMSDSRIRKGLYGCLVALITNHNLDSVSMIHVGVQVLEKGVQDRNGDVAQFCRNSLGHLESSLHPRMPTLQIDKGMKLVDMEELMENLLVVHSVRVGTATEMFEKKEVNGHVEEDKTMGTEVLKELESQRKRKKEEEEKNEERKRQRKEKEAKEKREEAAEKKSEKKESKDEEELRKEGEKLMEVFYDSSIPPVFRPENGGRAVEKPDVQEKAVKEVVEEESDEDSDVEKMMSEFVPELNDDL